MTTLFWIAWTIDIILLLVWGLESILTNSSYGLVFLLLITVGASWYLRTSHPNWALSLAGFPACILIFFLIGVCIALMQGNTNWH